MLRWDPSFDDVEFAAYDVEMITADGARVYIGGGTEPTQSSFIDNDPPAGPAVYEVQAIDFHENRTEPVRVEVE